MAHKGMGFFDSRGGFYRTPEEATVSDLATLLGRIGDGEESLAPGIAYLLLERRGEIERIYAEHDAMMGEYEAMRAAQANSNVAKLPRRPTGTEQG